MGRATFKFVTVRGRNVISIHALRGEGDNNVVRARSKIFISIHALRGEGDLNDSAGKLKDAISIHALRGEGDISRTTGAHSQLGISIHALRGEGDRYADSSSALVHRFQSTPSVGRATSLQFAGYYLL